MLGIGGLDTGSCAIDSHAGSTAHRSWSDIAHWYRI